MRIVLVAGCAMALSACGERAANDRENAGGIASAAERETGAKMANSSAWAKHVPWNSEGAEVKKTGSGVEYVVLASGPPKGAPPKRSQMAEVYYEGRLDAGGPAFDSAFERNSTETFPVAAVVPGFSEALQLMKPGDRWLVFIPSDLGYGARGAGRDIPPNSDLVFEIEMVSVQ
jgi:FKBP-type peptidyl-prolyl cis-trans isomerase